jgi:hypothetical protein
MSCESQPHSVARGRPSGQGGAAPTEPDNDIPRDEVRRASRVEPEAVRIVVTALACATATIRLRMGLFGELAGYFRTLAAFPAAAGGRVGRRAIRALAACGRFTGSPLMGESRE